MPEKDLVYRDNLQVDMFLQYHDRLLRFKCICRWSRVLCFQIASYEVLGRQFEATWFILHVPLKGERKCLGELIRAARVEFLLQTCCCHSIGVAANQCRMNSVHKRQLRSTRTTAGMYPAYYVVISIPLNSLKSQCNAIIRLPSY